jgi:hypothetical protein
MYKVQCSMNRQSDPIDNGTTSPPGSSAPFPQFFPNRDSYLNSGVVRGTSTYAGN